MHQAVTSRSEFPLQPRGGNFACIYRDLWLPRELVSRPVRRIIRTRSTIVGEELPLNHVVLPDKHLYIHPDGSLEINGYYLPELEAIQTNNAS
jgi:hypothetical protein